MLCSITLSLTASRWILSMVVGMLVAATTFQQGVGASSNVNTDSVNNWAVLVCTSRYWFNYRHMANTLGMYRTVKRLGIPDSNIILMLADDVACNPRNSIPGKVYANSGRHLDLYGESIEVDYRNYEVSVESFIRLLTGRTTPDTPVSKRLDTNENSNIFIYMTGHGGDEFLKFQDQEEISAYDIADAFQQMHTQKRYKEIFFMIDTCQATTMYSKFYSPGILATGSSGKGENSYSHHSDPDLGVAVIDRYTHVMLNFLEGINKTSPATLQDLFNKYSYDDFRSNAGVRSDLYPRSPSQVRLTEFFGGVAQVQLENSDDVAVTMDIFAREENLTETGTTGHKLSVPSAKERRTAQDLPGHISESVSIPLPAIEPFAPGNKPLKEDFLVHTRQGKPLHIEVGVALIVGHAACFVLWQSYKLGFLGSK